MSEARRKFTRSLYGFDAVMKRVPEDRWSNPSPCPGWTAREVAGHMIFGTWMMAAATGVGEIPSGSEADVAGDDPMAAWTAALDAVLDGLDRPDVLDQEAETPFGRMPIGRFAAVFSVEPLIHTWDLAAAAGVDPVLDVGLCERGIRQIEKAGDLVRGPGMYGDPVEVADSADVATRFIAFTGRDPAWSA